MASSASPPPAKKMRFDCSLDNPVHTSTPVSSQFRGATNQLPMVYKDDTVQSSTDFGLSTFSFDGSNRLSQGTSIATGSAQSLTIIDFSTTFFDETDSTPNIIASAVVLDTEPSTKQFSDSLYTHSYSATTPDQSSSFFTNATSSTAVPRNFYSRVSALERSLARDSDISLAGKSLNFESTPSENVALSLPTFNSTSFPQTTPDYRDSMFTVPASCSYAAPSKKNSHVTSLDQSKYGNVPSARRSLSFANRTVRHDLFSSGVTLDSDTSEVASATTNGYQQGSYTVVNPHHGSESPTSAFVSFLADLSSFDWEFNGTGTISPTSLVEGNTTSTVNNISTSLESTDITLNNISSDTSPFVNLDTTVETTHDSSTRSLVLGACSRLNITNSAFETRSEQLQETSATKTPQVAIVQPTIDSYFPVRKSSRLDSHKPQPMSLARHTVDLPQPSPDLQPDSGRSSATSSVHYTYTDKQVIQLEFAFVENPFCPAGRKQKLAESLDIVPEAALAWLRNARSRMRVRLQGESTSLIPTEGYHIANALRGVKGLPK